LTGSKGTAKDSRQRKAGRMKQREKREGMEGVKGNYIKE
jgi:hypothetical protein